MFSVVMYECESWTIKKAEHWEINAFELWYWSRLLKVPFLGASTGDPTHDKVMWESLTGQGGSGFNGSPGSAWACTPKPRSVCLLWTILHSSDINGGLSLTTFLWGQQLRALVNNSPGHNRVFQSKPLWWLSSLPDRFVQTPAAMHMIVYGLPTMRGTGSLWYSKNLEPFRELRSY